MNRFRSRPALGTLGMVVMTLAACADEPTSPARNVKPSFGVGDVITVTNLSGGTDVGSLRWALSHVTGGELIRFDPSLAGKTIILEATAETRESVTIEGPTDKGIVISGGGTLQRVLAFGGQPEDTAVLRNLTITGGNDGSLGGAGIYAANTTLIVENSTITGNGNPTDGAMTIFGWNITLVNTTVSGNQTTPAFPFPAIMGNEVALVNSTVAHNSSGGVTSYGTNKLLVLRNSVLSSNTGGSNCSSVNIVREGRNLSDDDSCGAPFEITIADPLLGSLTDNGGPTRTHALLAGSPAINAGVSCSLAVDQRYAPRDAQCDIGAYEFVDFTTADLTVTGNGTFDTNGWAVLTGTVRCSRAETFELHVTLQQFQKKGKDTIDVHAVSTVPIACTTGAQLWSATLKTTDEPFQVGDASATVATLNTKNWVTPASVSQSVKLFKARR